MLKLKVFSLCAWRTKHAAHRIALQKIKTYEPILEQVTQLRSPALQQTRREEENQDTKIRGRGYARGDKF
jgi:hypothetical protein